MGVEQTARISRHGVMSRDTHPMVDTLAIGGGVRGESRP
jgi:hypothetical protein